MRRAYYIVALGIILIVLASLIRIRIIYNGKQVVDIGGVRKERESPDVERLFGLSRAGDYAVSQAVYEDVVDACHRTNSDEIILSVKGGYLFLDRKNGTTGRDYLALRYYDSVFKPAGAKKISEAGKGIDPRNAGFVHLPDGVGVYDHYRRQMIYLDSALNYVGRDEEFCYYNVIGFYRSENGYMGRVYPDYSGHLVFREPAGRSDSVRMVKSDFTGDWQDVKCMKALENDTHVLLRTEKDFIIFDKSSGGLRKYHLFEKGYYYALLFDGRHIYLTPAEGDGDAVVFDAKKQTKKTVREKRLLLQLDNGTVLEPYAKNGEYRITEYKLSH